MAEPDWRLGPRASQGDAAVVVAVEARFQQIYQACFANEFSCNHELPIQVRAVRQIDAWRVFLLLTPWMLARVFLPQRPPGLPLPSSWTADGRRNQSYVVIGPALDIALTTGTQRAHLNHDVILGHYLIQPLAQAMEKYASADEVFSAWNEVIATRNRVMAEQQRDCPWQKEVSRREWFSRFLGGGC
jgi:hypothetical protein